MTKNMIQEAYFIEESPRDKNTYVFECPLCAHSDKFYFNFNGGRKVINCNKCNTKLLIKNPN